MSAKAQPAPQFKAFDRNGQPLSGGRVHTYEAGGSAPKATFRDAAGSALHPNPIVLDAAGEAAVFWGTRPYRVRVEDAAGVLQWEVDGFDPQVAEVPAPAVNLISNGSFEADTDADGVPDGWVFTAYAGGTVDMDRYDADTNPTPDTRHGAASLRMVSPGGAGNGGGYAETADFFEAADGQALDVAFSLKSTAAGAHLKAELLWHGADKGLIAANALYDEQAANPAAWIDVRVKAAVPAGARFAKLRLYGCVDDNPTAATVRFDHVTVRAVQPDYLRSGEADRVDGVLTFATAPVLSNNVPLYGAATGGTVRALAYVGTDDKTHLGNAALPTVIETGGALTDQSGNPIWHAGNDGAGSGLDADTVDGVQAASLVRADAADQVDGTLTFAADPTLNNNVSLLGKNAAGATRLLAKIGPDDNAYFGDANHPTRINSNGTLQAWDGAASHTIWHAGNDGAGSGLDADTVDGQQATDFAASGHGHAGFEGSVMNTVDVSVNDTGVVVVTLDVGTVQAGQRILVTARQTLRKGAVAGIGTMGVDRASGTAQIVDLTGVDFLSVYSYIPAGEDHRFYATTLFTVTTGGTLVLRLAAASVGSNATVYASEGLLGAVVLNL